MDLTDNSFLIEEQTKKRVATEKRCAEMFTTACLLQACCFLLCMRSWYIAVWIEHDLRRVAVFGVYLALVPASDHKDEEVAKLLLSNQIIGMRLDSSTTLIQQLQNQQADSIERFCRNKSILARLITDDTRDSEIFRGLNKNNTFSEQMIKDTVEVVREEYTLNPSQVLAVTRALGSFLSCIQGPPGTGKTLVGAAFVKALMLLQRLDSITPFHTLVSATSNHAVDNLEERISPFSEGRLLRWGNVDSRLLHTANSAIPMVTEHWVVERARMSGKKRRSDEERRLVANNKRGVITGTCISFASPKLDPLGSFGKWFLNEEAGLSSCGLVLCVLSRLKMCGAAALIGDHYQNPPIIKSWLARRKGAAITLLEYYMRHAGIEPVILTTQFRMSPALLKFINGISYDCRLDSDISCNAFEPPRGFPGGNRTPFAFIQGMETETKQGHSYCNQGEAEAVIRCAEHLLSQGDVTPKDLVILSAYHTQLQKLRDAMETRSAAAEIRRVRLYTLDAFQGHEASVVLLSTVRHNRHGHIGFLNQLSRLTVAFSRARAGLIVFGHAETLLSDDPHHIWKRFFSAYDALDGNYRYYPINYEGVCTNVHRPAKRKTSTSSTAKPVSPSSRRKNNERAGVKIEYTPDAIFLDTIALDGVRTVQRFIELTQKVASNLVCVVLLDHVQKLIKKKKTTWRKSRQSQNIEDDRASCRKWWSHKGFVQGIGFSKENDPTNLVYYLSFQGFLSNQKWSAETFRERRKRFFEDELPTAQMKKLKEAIYVKEGVLNDAGDMMESMLAIANGEDPDARDEQARLNNVYQDCNAESWRFVCTLLDQLVVSAWNVFELGSCRWQSALAGSLSFKLSMDCFCASEAQNDLMAIKTSSGKNIKRRELGTT